MPCVRSFQLQGERTTEVENKVALVTRATSGIGKATAKAFDIAGAKVVFSGRRKPEGKATEAQLREAGVDCLCDRMSGYMADSQ